MSVIGDFAEELGCPTPLFTATEAIYDRALTSGYGMQDTAAVCAVLETMAGVKRGRKAHVDAQMVGRFCGSWTVRTTLAVGLSIDCLAGPCLRRSASYCGSDITDFFALRCTILKPLALCCSSVGSAERGRVLEVVRQDDALAALFELGHHQCDHLVGILELEVEGMST